VTSRLGRRGVEKIEKKKKNLGVGYMALASSTGYSSGQSTSDKVDWDEGRRRAIIQMSQRLHFKLLSSDPFQVSAVIGERIRSIELLLYRGRCTFAFISISLGGYIRKLVVPTLKRCLDKRWMGPSVACFESSDDGHPNCHVCCYRGGKPKSHIIREVARTFGILEQYVDVKLIPVTEVGKIKQYVFKCKGTPQGHWYYEHPLWESHAAVRFKEENDEVEVEEARREAGTDGWEPGVQRVQGSSVPEGDSKCGDALLSTEPDYGDDVQQRVLKHPPSDKHSSRRRGRKPKRELSEG